MTNIVLYFSHKKSNSNQFEFPKKRRVAYRVIESLLRILFLILNITGWTKHVYTLLSQLGIRQLDTFRYSYVILSRKHMPKRILGAFSNGLIIVLTKLVNYKYGYLYKIYLLINVGLCKRYWRMYKTIYQRKLL